jgi:DNA-binding transcriptional LysR family regulator
MEWNDVRIFLVAARSGFFGEAAQALAASMEDSARGI